LPASRILRLSFPQSGGMRNGHLALSPAALFSKPSACAWSKECNGRSGLGRRLPMLRSLEISLFLFRWDFPLGACGNCSKKHVGAISDQCPHPCEQKGQQQQGDESRGGLFDAHPQKSMHLAFALPTINHPLYLIGPMTSGHADTTAGAWAGVKCCILIRDRV
jgi:hypothetical protein